MPHVPFDRLQDYVRVLADHDRIHHEWLQSLLSMLSPRLVARLPDAKAPLARAELVFNRLNRSGPQHDGRLPLQIVLEHLATDPEQVIADGAAALIATIGTAGEEASLLLPDKVFEEVAALVSLSLQAGAVIPPAHPLRAGLPADAGATAIEEWLTTLERDHLIGVLQRFDRAAHQPIAKALDHLQPAMPAPPPRATRHVALGRFPVVNRRDLFDKIEALRDGRRTVLVIRGERGVGKTFSEKILRDQVERDGREVRRIDLGEFKSVKFIAEEMLGGDRRLPEPSEQDSSRIAWVRRVADLVWTELNRGPTARWLLCDHLERTLPGEGVVPFLVQLAIMISQQPRAATGPRLILIDHGFDVPLDAKPAVADEEVKRAGEVDIAEFLAAARPSWTRGQAEAMSTVIVTQLDRAPAATWMVALAQLLLPYLEDT